MLVVAPTTRNSTVGEVVTKATSRAKHRPEVALTPWELWMPYTCLSTSEIGSEAGFVLEFAMIVGGDSCG